MISEIFIEFCDADGSKTVSANPAESEITETVK
jgi:hypothetical protein